MRIEKDQIGTMELPDGVLYGIHALRAKQNFPDVSPFHIEWYKAMGVVKKASYLTAKRFFEASSKAVDISKTSLRVIPEDKIDAMIAVANDISEGRHFSQFIVPAVQGGAGTSINMNVNEIVANAALQKMNKSLGDYAFIHPIEEANVFQSTNDVVPTALRVALLQLLTQLETQVNDLRQAMELKEQAHRHSLRLAYTQMQEAVPSSFGRLFSTYSDALSRDWWRISKCFERIKTVNLGGSAIGSGLTVPRYYIMEVTQVLKELTNLPLTRSENMQDNTANLDSFVEVHAILKAHAVNLEKISNDLRLLASDVHVLKEIELPQQQMGSSIMPRKVNPVIPEFVISASQIVYSNDALVSQLSAQGCLDLNAYLPTIGHKMIESLKLLIASCQTLQMNLVEGLKVNVDNALEKLIHSPAITTALLPYVGYNKAAELGQLMSQKTLTIFEANDELNFIEKDKLDELLKPENLLKEGFSIKDL